MRRTKDLKTGERLLLRNILSEKTGFYIKNNSLLCQAFTRSSYSAEQGGENSEMLEFIGDQVLNYYVVKIIVERCGALNSDGGYTFRVRENHLTSLKHELISNETLARIIDEWGIIEYLIVGKCDYMNEVDKQVKVKADLFESILGAIAVSSNWNPVVLEKAVGQMLSIDEKLSVIIEADCSPIQFNIESAVNILKELSEHRGCSVPKYEYGTPEQLGYDTDGNPKWACICTIISEKTGIERTVWATSKKMAKKAAAYLVLCDYFEVQNQYGSNGKYSIWVYKKGKLMPEHLMKE